MFFFCKRKTGSRTTGKPTKHALKNGVDYSVSFQRTQVEILLWGMPGELMTSLAQGSGDRPGNKYLGLDIKKVVPNALSAQPAALIKGCLSQPACLRSFILFTLYALGQMTP